MPISSSDLRYARRWLAPSQYPGWIGHGRGFGISRQIDISSSLPRPGQVQTIRLTCLSIDYWGSDKRTLVNADIPPLSSGFRHIIVESGNSPDWLTIAAKSRHSTVIHRSARGCRDSKEILFCVQPIRFVLQCYRQGKSSGDSILISKG